jgi:hypothetical protein
MTVQVTVVQDPGNNLFSDIIQWDGNMPLWADKWLKGATPIKTVDDFVRVCTEKKAAEGLIDYIQINGHGNDSGFRIGNDRIELSTIESFKGKLSLIAPLLSKNAAVEVSACEAGKAIELFRKFSQILGGVSIVGFLVPQTGGMGFVSPPIVVTPGGSYTTPAPASVYSQPSGPPPK